MSPDEARELLVDAGLVSYDARVASFDYAVRDVVLGFVVTGDEERVAVERLVVAVDEGRAPDGAVEAFQLLASANRERYKRTKAMFRTEIAKHGARALGMAVEAAGLQNDWAVMEALMDAEIEHERLRAREPVVPLMVIRANGAVTARVRPRPRRRRRTTPARPDHDPDLDPPAGAAA